MRKRHRGILANSEAAPEDDLPSSNNFIAAARRIERRSRLAKQRLAAGVLLPVDLPGESPANPWVVTAGVWRDHPDMDEYLEDLRAYREQVDERQPGA